MFPCSRSSSRQSSSTALLAIGVLAFGLSPAAAIDPWADEVMLYNPGANPEPDYIANANVVLGPPERITGENTPFGSFPGGVTMFSGAWGIDEIISIGAGGQLVVRFDEPITNDPSHPFGVDLIVFGNSFFSCPFPSCSSITGMNSDPGNIDVAADGLNWQPVGSLADTLFPTQGHLDSAIFGDPIGVVPTDFLTPVNPAFTMSDFLGRTYAEALALYNGSGGGTPVDIGPTGLNSVSYVRITVPAGSGWSTEIDAFAAVPEPATLFMLALGSFVLRRGRRC